MRENVSALEHCVAIRYAQALAEQIPPVDVRLRRDAGQSLGLVAARYAFLHRATREQDGEGRIATFGDYDPAILLGVNRP